MKQIKALIVREKAHTQVFLTNCLSEWGIQFKETNNLPEIKEFSSHIIFIEGTIYNQNHYLWKNELNSLKASIIVLDTSYAYPVEPELDKNIILSIPYTKASLFQVIQQSLCLSNMLVHRQYFLKKFDQTHDLLDKLSQLVSETQRTTIFTSISETTTPQTKHTPPDHTNDVLCQIRPLVLSLLQETKKSGPLHHFETQLQLLWQFINELKLNQHSQQAESNPFAELVISHPLSQQEIKIVSMITSGMTSEEIAEQLFISSQTVKCHRRNIRRKLNLVGSKYSIAEYIQKMCKD